MNSEMKTYHLDQAGQITARAKAEGERASAARSARPLTCT